MMESHNRSAEQPAVPPHVPGTSIVPIEEAGYASTEITVPSDRHVEPDVLYGDAPDAGPRSRAIVRAVYEQPSDTDEIVPDYANYAPSVVPRARQEVRIYEPPHTPARSVRVKCSLNVGGTPKHGMVIEVPRLQTDEDQVLAMREYMERLRHRGKYEGELDMNKQEGAILTHYMDAQRRIAADLGIEDNVLYDLTNTPYHVLPDKAAVDKIIRHEMSDSWVSPTGGSYTPITGALWPRYVDIRAARQQARDTSHPQPLQQRQLGQRPSSGLEVRRRSNLPAPAGRPSMPPVDIARMQRGFARLIAESSATFIGVPENVRGGIRRGGELSVQWGIGYKRPDLLPSLGSDGLHRAVTEMATARILREGGYKGPVKWQSYGVNAVLDGVIRAVAERHSKRPQQVANALLAGYYNGDLTPLRRVAASLPKGALHELTTLRATERDVRINHLSRVLDIPGIAKTYKALSTGENPPIYRY